MVKNPKIRKQSGRKNQPNDVTIINILRFLKKGPANKTKIGLSKGLNGVPNTKMNNLLDQICEDKWAKGEQSEYATNVTIFSIMEQGMKMLNDVEKIDNEELLKLDFFKGISKEV